MSGPLRVVKVGGSLLDWSDFPPRLAAWLAADPWPGKSLLVVGGGPFADAIRAADARFGLSAAAAHGLCVDCLGVTAALVAQLTGWPLARWPNTESAGSFVERLNASPSAAALLDCRAFLQEIEPHASGPPLAHDWSVTTDTIAARVAELLGPAPLVLLKSCAAPPALDWPALAQGGLVDAAFPALAARLAEVRWVNLRQEG